MSLGKHRLDGVKGQSLAHGGAQGSAPQQVQPVPGGHADPGESEGGGLGVSGGEQERGNADGVLYLHAALVERRQDAALVQSGVSKAFVEKKKTGRRSIACEKWRRREEVWVCRGSQRPHISIMREKSHNFISKIKYRF